MRDHLMSLVNRMGNTLPHGARRFLLDRLKLNRLMDRLGKDAFSAATLPNGMEIVYNPLLHGHVLENYEPDVVEAAVANLRKGGVFYDVGANIGLFSLLLSEHASQVIAFEPEHNNLSCLRRTVEHGPKNIRIFDCALGASDGTMMFDRRGGAFSGRLATKDAFDGTLVPVRSVDSVVAEGASAPDLMKIDVEGGEGGVLQGALNTLRAHRPTIICEMHADDPEGVRLAFDILKEAGYKVASLGTGAVESARHVVARPG